VCVRLAVVPSPRPGSRPGQPDSIFQSCPHANARGERKIRNLVGTLMSPLMDGDGLCRLP
jgi:hypothetical protein